MIPREQAPVELQELLHGDTAAGWEYRQNTRRYNSVFSMASSSANVQRPPEGGGIHSLTVNGTIHHLMSAMEPQGGNPPKFAQLYIFDTQHELQNRTNLRVAGPGASRYTLYCYGGQPRR